MKVLLYQPRVIKNPIKYGEFIMPPLSLLSVASLLVKNGYDVKIFDRLMDKNANEKILKELNNCVCVGFSVWTGYSITDSLELSKKIKEINSNIPTIWGGWHPSILPLETIKNPYVDIVVRGQGEKTFFELVECLKNNSPLNKVKGITYKKKNKIITNPDRERTPLDDLPSFPFHILDMEKYVNNIPYKRSSSYISSQGCPYNCSFCADSLIYNRKRFDLSAERVIQDLKVLVEEYRINNFFFGDTNFFVDKDKVIKICKAIIKNNWKIEWHASERVDHFHTFNDKELKLIKDSGCCLLKLGAESGSQKILDFLNKGFKVEDIINFSKLCKKYDFNVKYDFVFGLPNETQEDLQKTFNLLGRLYKINRNSDLTAHIYTPYPGTPLYNKVINEYGFKPPKSLIEWSKFDDVEISETAWIDKKYKEKLNMFIFYLQFAFLNYRFVERAMGRVKKKIPKNKFRFLIYPIHLLALLRFKFNFFKLPIDFKIYRIIMNLGKKIL